MNDLTLERMRKMKLYGMHRLFKTSIDSVRRDDLTPDEMASELVNAEWDDRQNRSLDRSLKNAKFRYKAAVEQIEYESSRNIDKNLNQLPSFLQGSSGPRLMAHR